MKNHFEIRGDVTAIFLNSKRYGQMETLISTIDLPMVMEQKGTWYPALNPGVKSFYAWGKFRNELNERINISLHRWITNAPKNLFVDHINHLTLDNRQSNLRVCTVAENTRNQRTQRYHQGKTSKFKGVYFEKSKQKYRAQIYLNKKRIYLGMYDSELDAARVYNFAASEFFEEFANLNNLEQPTN